MAGYGFCAKCKIGVTSIVEGDISDASSGLGCSWNAVGGGAAVM